MAKKWGVGRRKRNVTFSLTPATIAWLDEEHSRRCELWAGTGDPPETPPPTKSGIVEEALSALQEGRR